jgi:hypothetical protein
MANSGSLFRQKKRVNRAIVMGRSTDRYPSGVSCTVLAKWMKLDKSTVSRRVNRAIELGYLRNEQLQKGCPALILPAETLPEEGDVLPPVEALQCCSVTGGEGLPNDCLH